MSKAQFLAENLRPGEIYAGLILGKEGQLDYHLILLTESAIRLIWLGALAWAVSIGGDLPTRREQSLLFANCKEEFEGYFYWSNEQHAHFSGYAWMQNFAYGNQYHYHKSDECRAKAVRRVYIEEEKA